MYIIGGKKGFDRKGGMERQYDMGGNTIFLAVFRIRFRDNGSGSSPGSGSDIKSNKFQFFFFFIFFCKRL